jgi:hypothetical protein
MICEGKLGRIEHHEVHHRAQMPCTANVSIGLTLEQWRTLKRMNEEGGCRVTVTIEPARKVSR